MPSRQVSVFPSLLFCITSLACGPGLIGEPSGASGPNGAGANDRGAGAPSNGTNGLGGGPTLRTPPRSPDPAREPINTAGPESSPIDGGIADVNAQLDAGSAIDPDAGVAPGPDAGSGNSDASPAAEDAGTPDTGTPDTGTPDADTPGTPDAGTPGTPDAGTPGTPDAGSPPVSIDPFVASAVGSSCGPSNLSRFVVLAAGALDCSEHQSVVEGQTVSVQTLVFGLPNTPAPFSDTVAGTHCAPGAGCVSVAVDVQISVLQQDVRATGTWSAQLPAGAGSGSFDASWCDFAGGPAAVDIDVDQVAVYQSVKVRVVDNGQAVGSRSAPIVSGKDLVMRVFADRRPAFTPRNIEAVLRLEPPSGPASELSVQRFVDQNGSDSNLGSTFNFDVSASMVVPGMRYSVSLNEVATCAGGAGSTAGARFPQQGTSDLGVESEPGDFEIVLVPVRYNADGSGRLPDTSAGRVDQLRDHLFARFPVAGVSISVRQPFDWNQSIQRSGSGWADVLNAILSLRQQDNVGANTYYYAVVMPASSFSGYCSGGCVAGIGSVPSANQSFGRGSIGLGFPGDDMLETAAHELGHNLGRPHAPCGGVADADPQFPHANGGIGVWGYDPIEGALISPSNTADLMGYCNPTWISDYNYNRIFDRLVVVNQNAPITIAEDEVPSFWRVAISDGDLRWGTPVELARWPRGERISARMLDAYGTLVAELDVYRYDLTHGLGALILVPEPIDGARIVEIAGHGRIELEPDRE